MSLRWASATVLSLTEFEVCWEALDLGETPWQLDPPRPGRTPEERRAIVSTFLDGLRRRGLADPRGPRLELADRLRLLATADASLDLRIRGQSLCAGVGARRGRQGVVAVRHAGEIALLDVPAGHVPGALADLLGPVEPGRGRPVRIAAEALDAARAAGPDLGRFVAELARHGVWHPDGEALVGMCGGVTRRGQFGGSVRTRDGRLRRAPHVVGVHRTGAGDYLQLRRDGAVTIAPLDRRTLLDHLGELAGHA